MGWRVTGRLSLRADWARLLHSLTGTRQSESDRVLLGWRLAHTRVERENQTGARTIKEMTARDVMNPRVITIRADRTVQEAAVFLVSSNLGDWV